MSQVSFKSHHFLHLTRNWQWLSTARRIKHRFLTSLFWYRPFFSLLFPFTHQICVSQSLIPWTPSSFPAPYLVSVLALVLSFLPFRSPIHSQSSGKGLSPRVVLSKYHNHLCFLNTHSYYCFYFVLAWIYRSL